MSTRIRLRRVGRRKQASFRIVVTGQTHAPAGRFTEQIGKYNPRTSPSFIEIDEERALHWIREGAEVTDTVRSLFRRTGILAKATEGGEPEGVVRIGDVNGQTIFPAGGAEAAAAATVTRAPAEEAEEETAEAETAEAEGGEAAASGTEAPAEEAEAEAAEPEAGAEAEPEASAEDEAGAPEETAEDDEAADEEAPDKES